MDHSKVNSRAPPPGNTGYTYSHSSSYSTTALDFEKEHRITPVLESPRMSRRSLRLHSTTGLYGDDSLDSSLNHMYHSASFSAGGASRRDSKALKSRRSQQHAVSCSQSLLLTTPLKSQHGSQQHNSSLHSVAASDASLLSSMLDKSCIQERTLVDGFWGLDEDSELKERTMTDSMCEANGDINSAQTQTSMVNGSFCKGRTIHLDRNDALTAYSKHSSTAARSATNKQALTAPAASPSSTIYARDKSRKHRTGKSATGAFWWLGTGWYHLATVMSLLNIFVLTRCLPKLLKLLLILLPFLLVLLDTFSVSFILLWVLPALWHWGPSSLLSVLPAINITEWRTAYSFSQTPLEPTKDSQPIMAQPPPAVSQPGSVLVSVDSERLARLEQRLAQLWEKVERGGRRQENQHREVLSLYQSVREQLDTQTDKDSMGLWVSGLLEERLLLLKSGMEKDAALRSELSQEIGEQYVVQQQGQASRLAQLEVLLQTLTAKTEEVQRRQADTSSATPALPPVPVQVNVGVDSESRDALLAEVQLLEATLGGIRQDLQGVMGCQGMCDRLDTLHETVSEQVSAQVRTELRALFSRSEQVGDSQTREKELPESLLQWLSERYVSGVDVHASLTSLELSILQNVTLQLEKSRARQETHSTETVTQTVMHTVGAAGAGMSEEHVQLIVKNALKLYSQDRTGLVDYALESGGGSILSTRCSETYETKTALMSLFGLPLWYFSQSPRVAIQPDVHPGNCWAFQGSHGYLVIRLSMRIVPSAFSLEHIPKSLSPTGTISSAPRQFTVYGLDDEYQEEGKLLGSYTYQDDEDALQTYPVTEENDKAYQIIEVRVLSNWGHPEYTCLYRIRVHGQPSVN
ncbi:SUN domain-containing protein 1 isoform X12 [Oncorhynchus tshawytscha]|uniref:SUN domain-containing protein 1 isoform X12 n=1 Tax=Oncorhynchus tshawytscha TaxID=74940 RepID=UPI000D09EC0C|nr:SUN domain-containing protein 1 isoform X12 [Oncorhynchus tshawytscha]